MMNVCVAGVGTGFRVTSVSTAIWNVSMEEEAAFWTATFMHRATVRLATQVKTLLLSESIKLHMYICNTVFPLFRSAL